MATDREKIVKGLECCLGSWNEAVCPGECPYTDECLQPGWAVMCDALEALREGGSHDPGSGGDT